MNDDQAHTDLHRSTDNTNRSTFERRVTVPEAAEILGISPEAVRARLNRGTLKREKGGDGTAYVRLNADQMRSNGDHTEHSNADRMRKNADSTVEGETSVKNSLVFELMQDQISFMRSELERKDTIIMSLTQ